MDTQVSESMNQEIKAKWVAALRSGNYEQGHYRLRSNDRYCCLGVLCDIVGGGEWIESDAGYKWFDKSILTSYILPLSVQKLANLSSQKADALMRLNDQFIPFNGIADYIEINL